MVSTGSIAPNFHEGTRSEYLAQYVFSAFGTSISVPHAEDAGINLYCTLGERIGQRLHVQNYYFVQVKSQKGEIRYEGEKSVEWLLSHRYPLLICFVDKKSSRIEVFQTLQVTICFAKAGVKSITLLPDSGGQFFKNVEPGQDLKLHLGLPILDFDVSQMQDEKWVNRAMGILKFWVELDQESISQKPMGLTLFRIPESYETNQLPDVPKKFIGNFRDIRTTRKQELQYYDTFFRLLSQLVNQVAAEKDPAKFDIIANFAGQLTSRLSLGDSWGLRLLAIAVNTGAAYLKHPGRLTLTSPDGKKYTPTLTIQE